MVVGRGKRECFSGNCLLGDKCWGGDGWMGGVVVGPLKRECEEEICFLGDKWGRGS